MNMADSIAAGNRRCACTDVRLVVSSYELTTERPWSSNPIRNLVMNVAKGIRYGKPRQCWKAVCSQCGKAWLFGDTAAALRRNIKVAGLTEVAA